MRTLKFRIWNTKGKCFYTSDHVKANFFNFIEKMPDQPIMQFTGLLDRHGKDIYEGDILKENLSFGGHKSVEYIGNGFWCKNENGDRSMPTEEYREVIGNIYENPELVKSV